MRRFAGRIGSNYAAWLMGFGFALLTGAIVAAVLRSYHLGWRWTMAPGIGAGLLVFGLCALLLEEFVLPWQAERRTTRRFGRLEEGIRLADRVDELASLIYQFEQRDPEGNVIRNGDNLRDLLGALAAPASQTETSEESFARFDLEYGPQLRSTFHELVRIGWVHQGEMALFYTPRKAADRVALAARLRQISWTGRSGDLAPR